MVFLREGGKDELSLLLKSHRHRPGSSAAVTATSSGSGSTSGRRRAPDWAPAKTAAVAQGSSSTAKGKERATDAQDEEGIADDATAATSPSKRRKLAEMEPTDSLLHRLAGPSTGKAGLKRDPNEVRAVIYESSKGGNYFKNEERKDEELTAQIQRSLKVVEDAIERRGGNLAPEEKRADQLIAELEAKRDLSQCIVVVDCDAFYASVEELDDPSLVGKAFGVGEGVLTTASYEARKFGCRSAMPGYIAKKLCPHLIFVKPDFTKYSTASRKVMAILDRYDPNMAPASLDEAYMNLTPYLQKTKMTAEAAIAQMREEVKTETGLTVSAGCGPNTMIAKIAADFNKPDGQCVIPPTAEAARAFMLNLSVRKIPGIGRVTERWLEALGILKCADIYTLRGKLTLAKPDGITDLLYSYLGMGKTVVQRGRREDRRGVGHETTFSPIWRPNELDRKLREIADSLGEDLARLQYSGKTLTLKLKLETYEVSTRARTLDNGVLFHTADQLYKYGKLLLDHEVAMRNAAYDAGRPIKGKGRDLRLRLMGLKVSGLRDDSEEAVRAREKKGTGFFEKWAKSSVAKAGSSSKAENNDGPIDLTLLDASDNDDDSGRNASPDSEIDADGFSEIFLEAAPCPSCHTTISFQNNAYETHVAECLENKKHKETIDLLSSSQDWDEAGEAGESERRAGSSKQKHGRKNQVSKGINAGNASSGKAKKGDAFSALMKKARKRGKR